MNRKFILDRNIKKNWRFGTKLPARVFVLATMIIFLSSIALPVMAGVEIKNKDLKQIEYLKKKQKIIDWLNVTGRLIVDITVEKFDEIEKLTSEKFEYSDYPTLPKINSGKTATP